MLAGTGSGLELEYPARMVPFASCLGHTPFALWLIGALKPRMLVELGVHSGNSYCAFLQAVQMLGLETRCFGIDQWHADGPAGQCGDEVYQDLCGYHDPRYGTFSTLLRNSFDAALPYFSETSVDLIHLDGFQTYEAVSSGFASWLPKMSSRGIALFHGINVRERDFGIWRYWEDLSSRYPHFEFLHSHGLGVVYVGKDALTGPLKALFEAKANADGERIQRYFARLGTSVIERFTSQSGQARVAALESELASVRSMLMQANEEVETVRNELRVKSAAAKQADIQTLAVRQRMVIAGRLQRELMAANAEKNFYQQQFNQIIQSRTWRSTEPMRRVVAGFRRLLPYRNG